MSRYLITEEWNAGGIRHAADYGKVSEARVENVTQCLKKWSPFGYWAVHDFDNEAEYRETLTLMEKDDGTKISSF